MKLIGIAASGGRGCGPVIVHWPSIAVATAPHGAPAELLERALQEARSELATVIDGARTRLGDQEAAIFEVQSAMLDDPAWVDPIRARVAAGEAPQAAVLQVSETTAAQIAALGDEYLRERAADIRDLGTRVVRLLGGGGSPSLAVRIGSRHVIVAARDLTPSEALSLDPEYVQAVILEGGGRTSHMAILARQLGIPAVVGVPGLMATARDDILAAVDGNAGTVELEPPEPVLHSFTAARVSSERVRADPVTTRDGVAVHVFANAASPADVLRAVASGADGIGLYRTEFLFLERATLPGQDDQAEIYAQAAEAADGRPIVFRTLDIGGDKDLPSIPACREENPFLGVRGIRFSLAHPEIFDTQLRALAAVGRRHDNIAVMLPMVTGIDEFHEVRLRLKTLGADEAGFALGAMVEVPAAAVLATEFAEAADFLSVGTNDLTQYLLAVDRGSEALTELYNELHPAVLRVLLSIAGAAESTGRPLSVCGELAARPGAAALLLGLGYRRVSVVVPRLQAVKRAVEELTVEAATALAMRAVAATRAVDVERLLG